MKIYIASALRNAANVQSVRDRLIGLGHTITYDWTTHNKVEDVSLLEDIAKKEMGGVIEADLLVVLWPAGFGTHCEFGIAAATGKPIYMHLPDDQDIELKSFYFLERVSKFTDLDQLIAAI
jgi:nucleoside 2-deoxyribosyltransferase